MKYNNAAAISTPGQPGRAPGLLPQPGDDFLGRVNMTISNFKELLEMFKSVRGIAEGDAEKVTTMRNEGPAPGQAGFSQFVQLLIQNGYGDTPLGELFDKVKPYSIKQIMEVINRARP